MKVVVLDDYHDTVRDPGVLPAKLDSHDVIIWNNPIQDVDGLAAHVADAEALVLIREPSRSPRDVARDFIHQPMPQRTPPVSPRTRGPDRSTNFRNLLQKRN